MRDLTRRKFVQQLSFLGVLGVGTTMAGCGGGDSSGGGDMPAAEAPAAAEPVADAGFSCMDTSGLEEADVTMRNTLLYTDTSETEGQNCANCQLYVLPVEGSDCGTCITVKGPIHPDGWCSIWAAQTA